MCLGLEATQPATQAKGMSWVEGSLGLALCLQQALGMLRVRTIIS